MDLNDLLNVDVSTFKKPPLFPEGTFKMVITAYDRINFFWPKTNTKGQSYVPTLQAVESVEAESEDEEVANEMRTKLEDFGDWTKRKFRGAYTKDDMELAFGGVVNFPIFECDSGWNPVSVMRSISRFYVRDKESGEQTGFVYDILGLDYPEGAPLGQVMEDTINCEFYATIAHKPNKNPSKQANVEIVAVAPVID